MPFVQPDSDDSRGLDIPNSGKTDNFDRKTARPKSQHVPAVHKHVGPLLSR